MASPQSAIRNQPSPIRWVAVAAFVVVLLSSLPYVIVALTTPAGLRFGGVLVHPIDGQSYLAKMRQGYDGYWLFRLPYTAGDEPDALVYTHYPVLGHLARLTGWSLVATYHVARAAGGWLLLLTLYAWIARVFDSAVDRRRAWLFVALTSGLGWTGIASTDVTIPESNTFFSLLTNAHFAASMALMLIAFMAASDAARRRAALAAIGLAILQPFAPIVVFAALGLFLLLRRMRGQPAPPTSPEGEAKRIVPIGQAGTIVVAGLSVAPLMLYFYFLSQRDPMIQGWAAQNSTPSPAPIEYLAGYGLMWLLAIPGARVALKRGRDVDLLLVAWLVAGALLLYAPFPLQRRFSLGLHIPIVLLAVMGLNGAIVPGLPERAARWLPRLVLIALLPSTLLLLLATSTAAIRPPDPRLFFSADEAAAFDWLRDNVPRDSVVLAAPETGLFLPAWAATRVIYGHPFETVDAEKMKATAEGFFAGTIDRDGVIREYGADTIFFGPREKRLGTAQPDWMPVFGSGDVTIYRIP